MGVIADQYGGPEPETQRRLALLAAVNLDRGYSTGVWFAPLFAALGIALVLLFARAPSPDMPPALALIIAPVASTFILFPVIAALFYRSRFPRIIKQVLEDPGTDLAASFGMIPGRVPVFSDGGYVLMLAWTAFTVSTMALAGGGRMPIVVCFVEFPVALGGAYVAAAWMWWRSGRPELMKQLALAVGESLPSAAECKAWAREHRGDEQLLPEPPPLDETVTVSDVEHAAFEREMEVSDRLRRGWLQLAACAASLLTVLMLGSSHHLLRLGAIVLVQAFVGALCVLYSHSRQLRQIVERPRWFVYMRTHRMRRRRHQRTADPMEGILKVLLFAALVGSVAYAVMCDGAGQGWGWGLIATVLFPFTAFNVLDAMVWRAATCRKLAERVGVNVEELMVRLSHYWSWLRGWQRHGLSGSP